MNWKQALAIVTISVCVFFYIFMRHEDKVLALSRQDHDSFVSSIDNESHKILQGLTRDQFKGYGKAGYKFNEIKTADDWEDVYSRDLGDMTVRVGIFGKADSGIDIIGVDVSRLNYMDKSANIIPTAKIVIPEMCKHISSGDTARVAYHWAILNFNKSIADTTIAGWFYEIRSTQKVAEISIYRK